MSSKASFTRRKALFSCLPRELREGLIGVGRRARNIFGHVNFQDVFDDNLPLLEQLASNGATAAIIGELLAAAGVTRKDGSPLPEGTVSSALSRARERAGRCAVTLQPAGPCMHLQSPATPCKDPLNGGETASFSGLPQRAPVQRPPVPMTGPSSVRTEPNGPASFGLPASTRRTAALLADIRSENDEDRN